MSEAKPVDIEIVIADDHPIFLQGLRQVIEAAAGLTVVAQAADGAQALERLRQCLPRVAVLDINMPVKDGFAVMQEMREEGLAVAVIFLTMHRSEALFNAALDGGAQGYVLKDSAIIEVVNAIRAVADGEQYLSPALSTYRLNRRNRDAALVKQTPGLADLTPTERRVLRLIADNQTSREIAAALFISVRTVEHHRAHICEKLDLHGSNALLKFALAHKSELASLI